MRIESTGSSARWPGRHVLALAALLAASCSWPLVTVAAGATRLPVTESEKKTFDAVRTNQLQLAVSTLMRAPEGEKVLIAELADEHGMTALHWATKNRNAAGIRWLLDKGAELELKDDQGRTPLKIALDNVDTRAMTMLIDRGAQTSTALPGHDQALGARKKTSDVVDYMINSLGLAYYEGKGVAKDQARSAEVFARGCEADSALACHNLGTQNSRGEGVPKDVAKAVTLYQKACDGKHAQSCAALGGSYYLGEGVPKDKAKAAAFYELACNGDWARSCYMLSMIHGAGDGVAPDKTKAAMLGAKACKLGDQRACEPTVAAAPAATTATPSAAGSATAPCKLVKVQLGVDTVASVERDIQLRGGSASSGTGLGKHRLSAMSGDYRDAGTQVMAVNYDFDANAPTGRLIAVTIVNHANSGPDYENLLAARKAAAAAITGPLQQKSATEFTAAAPNCQLRLLPNADTWFIHEVYELPK